jgi:hypothetical protein
LTGFNWVFYLIAEIAKEDLKKNFEFIQEQQEK